jgi:hypothetical protein
MTNTLKQTSVPYLLFVGLLAWVLPGGGYYVLGDKKRATIVFIAILLTFLTGLYIGSIGVIDPLGAKAWYAAQIMNSPAVILIGNHVTTMYQEAQMYQDPTRAYSVFAKPSEIGQIYTSVAGLLNLLCIVNAVYIAHLRQTQAEGG